MSRAGKLSSYKNNWHYNKINASAHIVQFRWKLILEMYTDIVQQMQIGDSIEIY